MAQNQNRGSTNQSQTHQTHQTQNQNQSHSQRSSQESHGSQRSQGSMGSQAFDADKISETVQTAVSNVIANMEPQLNELAGKVAQQAVAKSKDFAQIAVRRVQKQPWYLVGFAALLLIGAALFLGFQAAEDDEERAYKH